MIRLVHSGHDGGKGKPRASGDDPNVAASDGKTFT